MSQTATTTTTEREHLSLSAIMKEPESEPKAPRQLPNEIYQLIIDHLPRGDLKNSRLANRSFAAMSEPRLFKKLVLVPSVDCLNNFLVTFDRSDVRRRISEFVYDDRWIVTLGSLKTRVTDLSESEMDAAAKKEVIDRIDAFYGAYLNSRDDVAFESALLTRILRRISHCERVYVKEYQTTGELQFDDIPRFITRNFPIIESDVTSFNPVHRPTTSSMTRLPGVLLSVFATRKVINTLRSANLTWGNMCKGNSVPKQFTAFHTLMPYLKNLEMILDGNAGDVDTPQFERLGHLLRAATDLRWLRIRLHGTPLTSEFDVYGFTSDAPLLLGPKGKHVFKHLKSLSVDSYVTHEHELIRLFRAHASTLRNLELRNILLLRQTSESPRGCWVRVIQALRHILTLTSMSFVGKLSNGGRQHWYVSEPPDGPYYDSCLAIRAHQYIERKSSVCPPELLAVAIPFGKEDVEEPTAERPWVKGDCSWSMTQRVPIATIIDEPDEFIYMDEQDSFNAVDMQMEPYAGGSGSLYVPQSQLVVMPDGGSYYSVQAPPDGGVNDVWTFPNGLSAQDIVEMSSEVKFTAGDVKGIFNSTLAGEDEDVGVAEEEQVVQDKEAAGKDDGGTSPLDEVA